MTPKDILVVEDEADLRELLRHNLTREGFTVRTAADGDAALRAVSQRPPDLILLDRMLPGLDGLEICRRLRREPATSQTPIIMVTAKGDESDVVVGLELGADDYVPKPFSMRVLLARVRTVLRRHADPAPAPDAEIRIHDLTISPGRHEVTVRGAKVAMTFSELRILHALASRPGWVLTRERIVDLVRGTDYPVTDRAVDVQIVGIRRKLGACADYIETVRGVGYRFRE